MSKMNFERSDKNFYVRKFCENTGSGSEWPPRDEAKVYVQNRLVDLILLEAKNIIKPQLDELKLTLSSHDIMTLVMNNSKADYSVSPADCYSNASNSMFAMIEQKVPGLIGQDDPSDWGFVRDV